MLQVLEKTEMPYLFLKQPDLLVDLGKAGTLNLHRKSTGLFVPN